MPTYRVTETGTYWVVWEVKARSKREAEAKARFGDAKPESEGRNTDQVEVEEIKAI